MRDVMGQSVSWRISCQEVYELFLKNSMVMPGVIGQRVTNGQGVNWVACGLIVQPACYVIELIVDVDSDFGGSDADIHLGIADWNQRERKFLNQNPIVSIRVFINIISNR